jgi:hypothetical protein
MLRGWKPSTSFSTDMADSTSCSSMCLGSCAINRQRQTMLVMYTRSCRLKVGWVYAALH